MNKIDYTYDIYSTTPCDINEHLPILKLYAKKSDIIYELGVRSIVSTWALLAGRPKKMVSVDIYHPSYYGARIEPVYEACQEEGIDFTFVQISSLDLEIEETDLLFIDTIHTYEQVTAELNRHASKTKKFILLHDTELPEMKKAVLDFVDANKEWHIEEMKENNNGLTVLKRVK